MKEIDVFKLASELGFDVRGAELSNNINSLIIVNETWDKIPGFDSNKVIAYNCKKKINIKRNSVAIHLKKYIETKSKETAAIIFGDANIDISPSYININLLVEECIQATLITNKKIIKSLYK